MTKFIVRMKANYNYLSTSLKKGEVVSTSDSIAEYLIHNDYAEVVRNWRIGEIPPENPTIDVEL